MNLFVYKKRTILRMTFLLYKKANPFQICLIINQQPLVVRLVRLDRLGQLAILNLKHNLAQHQ